jgi:F-type H+-transporting ATPase subunit b
MSNKVRTILLTLIMMTVVSGTLYASGGEHPVESGVLWRDFLWRILNFVIMAAILIFFLAKPLKNALAGRRTDIEKALAEAKQAKEEAETKFAEYDKKLSTAAAEIAEISESIRKDSELEKHRIIESAKAMALKIEQDAEKAAGLEVAKAKEQLKREAAELAVSIAEDILKKNFTTDDDTRLIDEYMDKVGELQ